MRWTRPLLLVAMLAILGGVGATFYNRLKEQNSGATARPKALPLGTSSAAEDWTYTEHRGDQPVAFVRAKDFQEVEGKFQLTGVELHLFQKSATQYDLVKSARADFDIKQSVMFSDGDVEITMGEPADDSPPGRLVVIRSSGVRFETKSGKATTDRPASFQFDSGEGRAVGAEYDPQTRELHLRSQVVLIWRGKDPAAKPMKVETSDVVYKEKEAKVYLSPSAKLTRDTLTLNSGPAVVQLQDGLIHQVDAEHAQGNDARPGRNIDYAADHLTMHFDDDGYITQIHGEQNAKAVSHAETADTTLTADRVDLDFNTASGESVMTAAVASGRSVAESKPIPKPGTDTPETRVLRSEVIHINMRDGGQEIDNVETDGAGTLEFLPNRLAQSHRWLTGDHFWIKYAAKNQIDSFRTINAATRTVKPKAPNAKEDPPPALTWSKDLTAKFDTKTNQLAQLEQWNNFRYEEGLRKAKADHAVLEQAINLIHLVGAARMWDNTGSTEADKILVDQKSGDFSADGGVNSNRMPDKKKDSQQGGGMLSEDEPMHARAQHMTSKDNNLLVRYEGNAVAWQGANRLQADIIEINRDNNLLKANGHVISQLIEKKDNQSQKADDKTAKAKEQAKKPDAPPVFTVVRAPELIYNDDERLADYKGGATLDRSGMNVRAERIRAYLRDADDDSSLDHAFADGKVQIVQAASDRTRTGVAEHAEYYVDDAKVVLEGGDPQLADSIKGTTRGLKLTWYSNDDRLLIDGTPGKPAKSKIRRK